MRVSLALILFLLVTPLTSTSLIDTIASNAELCKYILQGSCIDEFVLRQFGINVPFLASFIVRKSAEGLVKVIRRTISKIKKMKRRRHLARKFAFYNTFPEKFASQKYHSETFSKIIESHNTLISSTNFGFHNNVTKKLTTRNHSLRNSSKNFTKIGFFNNSTTKLTTRQKSFFKKFKEKLFGSRKNSTEKVTTPKT